MRFVLLLPVDYTIIQLGLILYSLSYSCLHKQRVIKMKKLILASVSLCGFLFSMVPQAYGHSDGPSHVRHHHNKHHNYSPKRHHHKRDKHAYHHYTKHHGSHYYYYGYPRKGCHDVTFGVNIGPHVTINTPRRQCRFHPKPRVVVHSHGYQW